ncbi:MAG: caspase family protein [Pseudomonadota bacterium]
MAPTRRTLLLAGVAGGALLAAPAVGQSIDIMRSTGRSIERAIRSQVGRALRPRLEVRGAYDAPPAGLAVSADSGYLGVIDGGGSLRVFDLVDGQQVHRGGRGLAAVAMGAGGSPVLSLGTDGSVSAAERWHRAPGTRLAALSGGSAVALGGDRGFVGLTDGTVLVLDAAGWGVRARHPGSGAAVTALAAAPDGAYALAGDADGGLRAISGAGATALPGWDADRVTAAAHLTGPLFAAGDEDGAFALIDASGPSVVAEWRAHRDAITGIATIDDRFATADEDGGLKIWDGRGREVGALGEDDWGDVDEAGITGLAATRQGGHMRLAVAGPGGAVHLVDPAGPRPLVQLHATRGGWGAVDWLGRFDGDAVALQDIAWRADDVRLPVENFSARYFEPGLFAKHLPARGAFLTNPSVAVADGIYAPPGVEVEVTAEPDAPGAPIRLEIEALAARPNEVRELRLFHNGKRVPPGAVTETGRDGGDLRRVRYVASLPAAPGENRIQAVARGAADIDSVPVEVAVDAPRAGIGALHVTGVGIDRYAGRALRLNYAVADARAVTEALSRRASGAFAGVNRTVLTDKEARRGALAEAFERLRATEPGDVAVIFLAGHARTVGERWYFLPQELTDLENTAEVSRVGISDAELAELLTAIPAQRVLLVIDACQSGAVIGSFEAAFGQRRALQELKRRTGVAVIAATRADQLAKEYALLRHGLLSYVVLEALGPGPGGRLMADRDPADGSTTAAELKAYVEARAPALAAELDARIEGESGPRGQFSQRVPVTPVGLVAGANFALAR